MKMERFHVGQLVWSSLDNAEVTIGQLGFDQSCVAANGHTWSWRRHVTLTPLEPKVGDRIRIVGFAKGLGEPWATVGLELDYDERNTVADNTHSERVQGCVCVFTEGERLGAWCRVILLRRASPPAEVKGRKFYGTMPLVADMPRTLPAGSRSKISGNDIGGWELDEHNHNCVPCYVPSGRVGANSVQYADPSNNINWSTVEIQPAPTSAGEAVAAGWVPRSGEHVEGEHWNDCGKTLRGAFLYFDDEGDAQCKSLDGTGECTIKRRGLKPISPPPAGSADAATRKDAAAKPSGNAGCHSAQPVGGGSLKPDPLASDGPLLRPKEYPPGSDPYAEHREREAELIASNSRHFFPKRLWGRGDALDRLAASRRKLAQTKQAMDRPAVERHPSDWNSEDADELYSTI